MSERMIAQKKQRIGKLLGLIIKEGVIKKEKAIGIYCYNVGVNRRRAFEYLNELISSRLIFEEEESLFSPAEYEEFTKPIEVPKKKVKK